MYLPDKTSPAPLMAVNSCARLREWVKLAQPNARVQYAAGVVLAQGCRAELREYVLELAGKGFLTPHVSRDAAGNRIYIVQRTARPALAGQL